MWIKCIILFLCVESALVIWEMEVIKLKGWYYTCFFSYCSLIRFSWWGFCVKLKCSKAWLLLLQIVIIGRKILWRVVIIVTVMLLWASFELFVLVTSWQYGLVTVDVFIPQLTQKLKKCMFSKYPVVFFCFSWDYKYCLIIISFNNFWKNVHWNKLMQLQLVLLWILPRVVVVGFWRGGNFCQWFSWVITLFSPSTSRDVTFKWKSTDNSCLAYQRACKQSSHLLVW